MLLPASEHHGAFLFASQSIKINTLSQLSLHKIYIGIFNVLYLAVGRCTLALTEPLEAFNIWLYI